MQGLDAPCMRVPAMVLWSNICVDPEWLWQHSVLAGRWEETCT